MGNSCEIGRHLAFVKNGEIIVRNGVGMKWKKGDNIAYGGKVG